jgi:hypothetical protein
VAVPKADAAVLLAAHLMTERAWVRLVEKGRGAVVELRAKRGACAPLAAEFRAALETQRLRLALAKGMRAERAATLALALQLADKAGAGGAAGASLPAEQARALAALASAPAPDPLGIRAPWETLERDG